MSQFKSLLHGASVRRSAFIQWAAGHRWWLSVTLAFLLAIPLSALFYFQYQSIAALSASSTLVLAQLGSQTTERLAFGVEDVLRRPRVEALLTLVPSATDHLETTLIEATFTNALANNAFVSRFYVWSAFDAEHRELLAFDRQHRHLYDNLLEAPQFLENVRLMALRKRELNSLVIDVDGRKTYILAHVRYREPVRDRMTSFFAQAVDVQEFRDKHVPGLLSQLIPQLQASTQLAPLSVTVVDARDNVIYPPGGSATDLFTFEQQLPITFMAPELVDSASFQSAPETWRLRVGYGDQTIEQIVASRERTEHALLTLLAVLTAVGLFLGARAFVQEARVAQLKSEFVLSVSHDLKTPLAMIQLYAETLEHGRLKLPENAIEYYRVINNQARRLTRLINHILDFSRIEAGMRVYNVSPQDLALVTKEVIESFRSQLDEGHFTVTLDCKERSFFVLAEREAAAQAIENLLSNAIKYSPHRREILVAVDRLDGYGRVLVTDHGIGIPSRLQKKILRKFFRVQPDGDSGPSGCGLGLAIVNHIMSGHGGFVRVKSEVGKGSTFALHFPSFD
jgi:signal transduction histidine kinase